MNENIQGADTYPPGGPMAASNQTMAPTAFQQHYVHAQPHPVGAAAGPLQYDGQGFTYGARVPPIPHVISEPAIGLFRKYNTIPDVRQKYEELVMAGHAGTGPATSPKQQVPMQMQVSQYGGYSPAVSQQNLVGSGTVDHGLGGSGRDFSRPSDNIGGGKHFGRHEFPVGYGVIGHGSGVSDHNFSRPSDNIGGVNHFGQPMLRSSHDRYHTSSQSVQDDFAGPPNGSFSNWIDSPQLYDNSGVTKLHLGNSASSNNAASNRRFNPHSMNMGAGDVFLTSAHPLALFNEVKGSAHAAGNSASLSVANYNECNTMSGLDLALIDNSMAREETWQAYRSGKPQTASGGNSRGKGKTVNQSASGYNHELAKAIEHTAILDALYELEKHSLEREPQRGEQQVEESIAALKKKQHRGDAQTAVGNVGPPPGPDKHFPSIPRQEHMYNEARLHRIVALPPVPPVTTAHCAGAVSAPSKTTVGPSPSAPVLEKRGSASEDVDWVEAVKDNPRHQESPDKLHDGLDDEKFAEVRRTIRRTTPDLESFFFVEEEMVTQAELERVMDEWDFLDDGASEQLHREMEAATRGYLPPTVEDYNSEFEMGGLSNNHEA